MTLETSGRYNRKNLDTGLYLLTVLNYGGSNEDFTFIVSFDHSIRRSG